MTLTLSLTPSSAMDRLGSQHCTGSYNDSLLISKASSPQLVYHKPQPVL